MKIAVEGCCHDALDTIYDTIAHMEKTKGVKIDLLLICGDFQATRNPSDLLTMAVPQKYRDMKYFYRYVTELFNLYSMRRSTLFGSKTLCWERITWHTINL